VRNSGSDDTEGIIQQFTAPDQKAGAFWRVSSSVEKYEKTDMQWLQEKTKTN